MYIQYTIFIIKKKITPDFSKSATMGFVFLGTQERVRNSRGKRAISVQATEVLLYFRCPRALKASTEMLQSVQWLPR